MLTLDPVNYRVAESHRATFASITRDNVDAALDAGAIEVLMRSGRFWAIRRNGKTKTWKRDATRVYIPYKYGLYGYGNITETDFRNV